MYKIGEFARKIGVSVKTVQRWDKSGRIPARRTLSGYRYYTEEDVRLAQGLEPLERDSRSETLRERKTIVYCRVSSAGQKPELVNQVAAMSEYCASRGITPDEIVTEIGGGLNFKRKKFLSTIFLMLAGELDFIVVAHKDRLCRFAFEFIEELAAANGCEILVANQESTSAQQELVEDLLAVVHCFSCRLYGLRSEKCDLGVSPSAAPFQDSYTKKVNQKVIATLDNPTQIDL
jgi:putative resolvase